MVNYVNCKSKWNPMLLKTNGHSFSELLTKFPKQWTKIRGIEWLIRMVCTMYMYTDGLKKFVKIWAHNCIDFPVLPIHISMMFVLFYYYYFFVGFWHREKGTNLLRVVKCHTRKTNRRRCFHCVIPIFMIFPQIESECWCWCGAP